LLRDGFVTLLRSSKLGFDSGAFAQSREPIRSCLRAAWQEKWKETSAARVQRADPPRHGLS